MQPLHFPSYEFRTRSAGGRDQIWDAWRRKWIALTPEEWVRQHLARYLCEDRGYPSGRIVLEFNLSVHGLKRRADLVLFDANGKPSLLAECKAPDVALSESVVTQMARYNLTARVPWLIMTNGLMHYCARMHAESGNWEWVSAIPAFGEL